MQQPSSPGAAPSAPPRTAIMQLEERVDRFYSQRFHGQWGGRHILAGEVAGPGAVILNSNDYLDIGGHPRILEAMQGALAQSGVTQMMSSLLVHETSALHTFERELAAFIGYEAGIVFPSGYMANLGLLQSIVGAQRPAYIDSMAHMSLWEGVKSARGVPVPFAHNDLAHLGAQIREHGPGVVVVDSVYSTNGSVAPLVELVELAEATGCLLVVDESHSLGTHGPGGAGMVAALGLTGRVPFVTGSLSKAFVSRAGFVVCSARLRYYVHCEAFPLIFSSAVLPHDLAGLEAVLALVRASDARRERLFTNARALRATLTRLGYDVAPGSEQIIAVEATREIDIMRLRDALERSQIFAALFAYPATPRQRPLLRFSVHAGLDAAAIERVGEALAHARALGIGLAPADRVTAARSAPGRSAGAPART